MGEFDKYHVKEGVLRSIIGQDTERNRLVLPGEIDPVRFLRLYKLALEKEDPDLRTARAAAGYEYHNWEQGVRIFCDVFRYTSMERDIEEAIERAGQSEPLQIDIINALLSVGKIDRARRYSLQCPGSNSRTQCARYAVDLYRTSHNPQDLQHAQQELGSCPPGDCDMSYFHCCRDIFSLTGSTEDFQLLDKVVKQVMHNELSKAEYNRHSLAHFWRYILSAVATVWPKRIAEFLTLFPDKKTSTSFTLALWDLARITGEYSHLKEADARPLSPEEELQFDFNRVRREAQLAVYKKARENSEQSIADDVLGKMSHLTRAKAMATDYTLAKDPAILEKIAKSITPSTCQKDIVGDLTLFLVRSQIGNNNLPEARKIAERIEDHRSRANAYCELWKARPLTQTQSIF